MNNNKIKMTQKLQKMINMSKKMTKNEFYIMMKYIDVEKFGKKNINYLSKEYANKNLNYVTQNKKLTSKNSWIKSKFRNEINKINMILNNDSIRKKIGTIKILAHGPTGTGKTTLIKEIGKLNKNYEFKIMDLENILSSKMGQTQINILTLATKINADKKLKIIFIDELDSIVSNREATNDVGEHSRIVSTFIKFLDNLDDKIIIMAATNVLKKIDKSIIRRFNIKIESKYLNKDNFFQIIDKEILNLSMNEINFLKSGLNRNKFTISEVNDLHKNVILEKEINNNVENILIILEFLKNDISYKNIPINISDRRKKLLKKVNIHV